MPVPGTTWAEPSPLLHVTAQARPSPSRTEMCVVEPSREASRRSAKPGSIRPSTKAGVRSAWASSMTATMSAADGAPSERSSRRAIASASSVPPADGGGLVRTWRPR
jgi:hypothetical protein